MTKFEQDFQDLALLCFPDCGICDDLEAQNFDLDSIALGFFLSRGYSHKQAIVLVRAANYGEFSTMENLAKEIDL